MKKSKHNVYVVEIIRYGSVELGVYLYAIFSSKNYTPEMIKEHMKEYNSYRGGKYPAYFIRKVEINNTEQSFNSNKERVDLYESTR